jgi:hypothetical protein
VGERDHPAARREHQVFAPGVFPVEADLPQDRRDARSECRVAQPVAPQAKFPVEVDPPLGHPDERRARRQSLPLPRPEPSCQENHPVDCSRADWPRHPNRPRQSWAVNFVQCCRLKAESLGLKAASKDAPSHRTDVLRDAKLHPTDVLKASSLHPKDAN